MKQFLVIGLLILLGIPAVKAQDTIVVVTTTTDTLVQYGTVSVYADPRLELFGKKLNTYIVTTDKGPQKVSASGFINTSGYRLMVLNSNDRELVMSVRTRLLQTFPDQRPYLSSQPPFLKLKFGDFLSRAEAERYRKQIQNMKLFTTNIYIVGETVRVRASRLQSETN